MSPFAHAFFFIILLSAILWRMLTAMVYVDDMRAGFGRMVMCHMIADTTDELMDMAASIGVDHCWLQQRGTHQEHFDICLSKRKLAVSLGAREVKKRELAQRLIARRAVAA